MIAAADATVEKCPICDETEWVYVFKVDDQRVVRCAGCNLVRTEANASQVDVRDDRTEAVASEPSVRLTESPETQKVVLDALAEVTSVGPLLVVADADDPIVPVVENAGYRIGRVASQDDLERGALGSSYGAALVLSPLQRVRDPVQALRAVSASLAPEHHLLVLLPLLDSSQARLLGRQWHEWRLENRSYFTRETLHLLLLRAGFDQVWFRRNRRLYTIGHLRGRTLHRRLSPFGRFVGALHRAVPPALRRQPFALPSGKVLATARVAEERVEPVLSIVVPVYNERATFGIVMERLLEKPLPGLRKEIIIVESNSTDGTRELVLAYRDHPEVKVLLQDRPRGKGNAVREGLGAATGDIILIQDADLEYDIDDYDALLAPLLGWRSLFVLGSRHRGQWKMREFTHQPIISMVYNLGHWLFTSLLNVLLGKRMTDPFTMFKIVRRDCLYGLSFQCNRFDFDHELLIKLVRKGYTPLEIPVNYRSRSFAEGKKVEFVRDGMTWLWTDIKYRFARLGPRPD